MQGGSGIDINERERERERFEGEKGLRERKIQVRGDLSVSQRDEAGQLCDEREACS